MKTKLHVCYKCAGDLGLSNACCLVVQSLGPRLFDSLCFLVVSLTSLAPSDLPPCFVLFCFGGSGDTAQDCTLLKYTTIECSSHFSPRKFFSAETITENHNWLKSRERLIMPSSNGPTYHTIHLLHPRLKEHLGAVSRRTVKSPRTRKCGVRFYLLEVSYTHEMSTVWPPEQG